MTGPLSQFLLSLSEVVAEDVYALVVVQTIFCFCLGSSPPGGPGGGSGLLFSSGGQGFWAGSGPDPGGYYILSFDFGSERSYDANSVATLAQKRPRKPGPGTGSTFEQPKV